MVTVDRIPVRFEGHGAGEAPLTWGQRELWEVIRVRRKWMPIGAWEPLPPGTTVDDAIAQFRFIMSSYPTLRTRLRMEGDQAIQVVAGSGEATLEVVNVPDDGDPAAVAKEVFDRYQAGGHDYATDWPVRIGMIRHRGEITHRVWVMDHLCADGSAALVMLREVAALDASGSRAAPTALDLARWQGSPSGQRQSRAALAYWERILRAQPQRLFPLRDPVPSGPRYWRAHFDSPALFRAAQILGERAGAELASVLLGLFVVSLARVIPRDPMVVQLVVNNRFRPGFADAVSPLIQAGLFAYTVPDTTVEAAIRQVRQRALIAYKYAYCDPGERLALIARLTEERGMDVDTECGFNDRRLTVRNLSGPVPTPEQVEAARPETTFTWVEQQDKQPYAPLYVEIDDQPDTVRLVVSTDIHFLAPDDVVRCIRGMEEIAVAAVHNPEERTGVPAATVSV